LNQFQSAFASFSKAIEINPHNDQSWRNKGLAEQKLNN